jgi:hypothetical protein
MNWSKLTQDQADRRFGEFVNNIEQDLAELRHQMRVFSSAWRFDYSRASVYYAFLKMAWLTEIEEHVKDNIWHPRPLYKKGLMYPPKVPKWRIHNRSRSFILCAGIYLAESVRKENPELKWMQYNDPDSQQHFLPTLASPPKLLCTVFPHVHSVKIVERGISLQHMERAILDYMFNSYDCWKIPEDDFAEDMDAPLEDE